MKQVIAIATMTVLLSLQAFADVTNQVIASLTYVGRSTEASGAIAYGSTLGSEVSAGLALALNPNQVIFDNGAYHTTDFPPSSGVNWASWDYYSGGTFQARHFQATFVLPTDLHHVVGFSLFSPYYTAYGNLIPIDDNAYFYLNGTFIGEKGTSYGATNGSDTGAVIHETNGWHQDGSFGSAPVASLHSGTNVIDIVAEDRLLGGGMDPLNVAILDVAPVPEPTTALLVLGVIPLLFSLRRKHTA
jgi:hypothetical protein